MAVSSKTPETTRHGLRISPSKRHSHDNRPIFDARGYCHGHIVDVTLQEPRIGEDGKPYRPSYKWELVCPGTIEPFSRMHWTWIREEIRKPSQKYSAYLELCLRLGLVKAKALPRSDKDIDFSKAIGLLVSYTLIRKDKVYRVDGESIALEKPDELQLDMWG
jgi:hypothetical protein